MALIGKDVYGGGPFSFFRWVGQLISTAVEWAGSLPGKVVLFCSTFFATFASSVSFVVNHLDDVATFFDQSTNAVNQLGGVVAQSETYSLLGYCLSLDVAIRYCVSIGGIFLGLVGTIIIALFAFILFCYIFPLVISTGLRVVSLISGGWVKP